MRVKEWPPLKHTPISNAKKPQISNNNYLFIHIRFTPGTTIASSAVETIESEMFRTMWNKYVQCGQIGGCRHFWSSQHPPHEFILIWYYIRSISLRSLWKGNFRFLGRRWRHCCRHRRYEIFSIWAAMMSAICRRRQGTRIFNWSIVVADVELHVHTPAWQPTKKALIDRSWRTK